MVNSGATLVRGMCKLLAALEGVDNHIDDILIHTKTWDDHIQLLQQVFVRLLDSNRQPFFQKSGNSCRDAA